MASTTTLKYGPKISLSHVTMKGGGGPDPFIVKDYEKGPFFAAIPKYLQRCKYMQCLNKKTNFQKKLNESKSAKKSAQKGANIYVFT